MWANLRDRIQARNAKNKQRWDSRSRISKAGRVVGTVAIVVAPGLALDAYFYRQALLGTDLLAFQKNTIVAYNTAKADFFKYEKCSDLLPEHYQAESFMAGDAAFRQCLIDEAPSVKSHDIALAFSVLFYDWLTRHEDDKEIRKVGSQMIDNGRTALAKWREEVLKPSIEVRDIQRGSLVGSLHALTLGHSYHDESAFDDRLDYLNTAEFRLYAPDVAEKQGQWLFDYYQSQK